MNYFIAEECKKYGKNGQDKSMCDSRGGTVTCKQCDQFSNVRSEMCPVMCGLCDRKYCRRTLEGPSVTL